MVEASHPLVQELLHSRRVACLATQNADGSIHMVAVWFLFEGDAIYVATSSRSVKARNLQTRTTASLMVDVRHPIEARGVTASGRVQILAGDESRAWNARIHRHYLSEAGLADPRIGPVFAQWDDSTLQFKPDKYVVWDMREADKAVFGSAMATNPDYLLPLDQ